MNMKHGNTKDGYNTPVRMYESFQQVKGKQVIKVYRVEFFDNNRWIDWIIPTPDKELAEETFHGLTS